jgi:hypothetical protein
VELDGCTTKNAVGDAGTLGLLQMVNHSCNPNCRLRPVDTCSGLVLFTLEALRDIPEGEEITIDYDARAAPSSKTLGLSFWQWNPPTSPGAAAGLRRIECGCAGEGLPCPNRLWRDCPTATPCQAALLPGISNLVPSPAVRINSQK